MMYIYSISTVKMRETISIYTEPYTKFVIKNLIGIKGKSESDVANFIIKDWIGEQREELREFGITADKAKKTGMLKN